MDMSFGRFTENRSKRTGKISDLVAVQEVRGVEDGSQPAENCTYLYGKENADHHIGTGFFIHKEIISAIKMCRIFSERMSDIILRRR